MSAHKVVFDLFRSPYLKSDPGDAGTLTVDRQFAVFPIVTAAAETRTLAQPTKAGIQCMLVLDAYVAGACTLTVTGGYNKGGETSMVLGAAGVAGDWVVFRSVKVGASYYWRVVASEGIATSRSFYQSAIIVVADGDTAITAAELKAGLLQMTSSTAGRAPTLPTGTAINAILAIGEAFDWSFLNLGNQTVTITGDTGHTIVGTVTLATVTSGMFRTKCTAANTAITYRLNT